MLGVYPNRDAASTLDFLDRVRAGMPFPVQRVQTDRGGEFFAHEVQKRLQGWRIKFRPNRPRAPHLNGKVERVQRTALEEFWSTAALKAPELSSRLEDWRCFYNQHRPHTSLGGRTPAERVKDLAEVIPSAEAVRAAYDPAKEIIRPQNTRWRWLPSTSARVI